MDPVNLAEYAERARDALDAMTWGYYASGAMDERTLTDNAEAWQRLRLRYRVLRGVGRRSLQTQVLGHTLAFPAAIAPMAFQQLAAPEGEVSMARAADDAGTLMILSTLSNRPMEDVVAASSGPVWFQLYVYKDREATKALVRRAEAAGCLALVLTVDAPLLGRRERDVKTGFHLPKGLACANLLAHGAAELGAREGDSGLAAYVAEMLDPDLTWDDVDWLRSITTLPVLVKGIVRGDDAALAVAHGAAGVVVSNHGGRQLDTAVATADALAEVVDAVGGAAEVLVDGGIRRGTDVLKALALGARAVLVGRPLLWGLAVDGQAGAARVLRLLRDEVDLGLALLGCRDVAELGQELLVR